jgi:hypothetical protein
MCLHTHLLRTWVDPIPCYTRDPPPSEMRLRQYICLCITMIVYKHKYKYKDIYIYIYRLIVSNYSDSCLFRISLMYRTPVLSYPVISYLIVSCLILSSNILSYRVLSYPLISYLIVSYLTHNDKHAMTLTCMLGSCLDASIASARVCFMCSNCTDTTIPALMSAQ